MVLDLRKLYTSGLSFDFFKPIDSTPLPSESEFEIEFCETILKAHPEHFEALVLLGDAYTRRGEYEKGLELDLRLIRIKPENKLIRYNLACSYALTGQKEKALTNLDKAIELGYCDVEHLRQDRDLEVLKAEPRFQNMIKKLMSEHQTQER